MSESTDRVLQHLSKLGFSTRAGALSPFGEELPLVTGAAWDHTTAQLALVAEMSPADSDDAWRQLLFAGSGLRHHLVGDGPAGFGTPIVLAIVDGEGERRLRSLTEDLAQRYALFHRVDLNLVRQSDLHNAEALDLALAPLLPTCRRMQDQTISRAEVQRFWQQLREEVERAAIELDDLYGEFREPAGRDGASALIGSSEEAEELPAPAPVESLQLTSFRSFREVAVRFAPVSIVHGPNGGGKTTLVEGLELALSGRSQRQPDDVTADEYARHLVRDGDGAFRVESDEVAVTGLADAPRTQLGRSVLGQDQVSDLVASAPADRYAALLTATGLEVPDLKARTAELVAETKREADAALTAAGLPPLPRADRVALKHLQTHLAGGLASRLPSDDHLRTLAAAVADAAGDGFEAHIRDGGAVAAAVAASDAAIAGVLTAVDDRSSAVADAVEQAYAAMQSLGNAQHQAARRLQALLGTLERRSAVDQPEETSAAPEKSPTAAEPPVPAPLAVRWLTHSRSLGDEAKRFRSYAEPLQPPWRERLECYAEALERAVEATPRKELELLTRAPASPPTPPAVVDEELWRAAGFRSVPADPMAIVAPASALAEELQRHAESLLSLAAEFERHPARTFGEHRAIVLRALCRFDLARTLRREGPVTRASEQLISKLLHERLKPVLSELVAAIVRFEWYFKPLQVPESGRKVLIGGLSTSQEDLDARMVLNAAERTVVGVAWFLALHLLQPADRRRVLILDDPTGAFDAVNQAGFISTLRAFVRLARPEQLVVTTHDDAVAAVLAEELAPVDRWPAATTRIRCQRDADDASAATVLWTDESSRDLEREAVVLGLQGEPSVFA